MVCGEGVFVGTAPSSVEIEGFRQEFVLNHFLYSIFKGIGRVRNIIRL